MKHVIYILFGMIVFVFPAWAELPESPMDVPVEDVLNSAELKAIGFPFDDLKLPPSTEHKVKEYVEKYHPDLDYKKWIIEPYCPLIEVGKCIVYLYRSGQMAEEKQAETLEAILKNCTQFEIRSNFYSKPWRPSHTVSITFATGESHFNENMTKAALVLTAHSGAIQDVAALLRLNDFSIENDVVNQFNLLDHSGYGFTLLLKLSKEQLLKLRPAQHAIISHVTTTVPLLRKAAVNESLPIPLRLKAVSYLLFLDTEILKLDFLKDCDRDFLESCNSADFPQFAWKNKDEEQLKKETREQNHRRLLFQKKIRK